MGGSPVAAQEASDDDAARVVVPVAGSHVESASNPLPAAPGSVTPVAEGDQEHSKREAPAEAAPAAAAAAAAAAGGHQYRDEEKRRIHSFCRDAAGAARGGQERLPLLRGGGARLPRRRGPPRRP